MAKKKVEPGNSIVPAFVFEALKDLATSKSSSTARYLTYKQDAISYCENAVCYHQISSYAQHCKGIAIAFQGYGGFVQGERMRPAVERDLFTTLEYPFVNIGSGDYNEVSVKWLEAILDPEGPFKSLRPLMYNTTPEDIQKDHGFIFPDVSLIPARLTWCFAIASRLGFANARVVWRYLHMRERGFSNNMALLIAAGFEHEVKNGTLTGAIIKSYTGGYLGPDVTAYAARFLDANPIVDQPFSKLQNSTYGSADVFKCGKLDLKRLRFSNWDEVKSYIEHRADEQREALKKAA